MNKKQKKEFDELIVDFKEILKKNSLKITKQREAILEAVFLCDCHFTPESLHQDVSKTFPEYKIGIATIYRSLQLLEVEGLVTSISFGVNGKKYEYGRKEHHDHMVCNSCGKLIEFHNETIENKQEEIAKEYGFKIEDHTMQIFGTCKECQEEER